MFGIFFCLIMNSQATTTGSKLFAALKGAVDGGLSIPHSPQRFVGYNKEEQQLDAAKLRKHIFGGHVAAYMKLLQPNEEQYKKRFSKFIAAGVNGDNLEALYKKVHANIRAHPEFVSKKKNTPHKKWSRSRMSRAQRKVRKKRGGFCCVCGLIGFLQDRVRQKTVEHKKRQLAAE